MKRTLICKICGKAVRINKYKIENPVDYTCAKCRGNIKAPKKFKLKDAVTPDTQISSFAELTS